MEDLPIEAGDRFQISGLAGRYLKRPHKPREIITYRVVDVIEKYLPDGTEDFDYTAVDDADPGAEARGDASWFSDKAFKFYRERGEFQLVGTADDEDEIKTHGGNDVTNSEYEGGEFRTAEVSD